MLETSPALLWTGKVGDAFAFRVWGSRAFVRDLSADKLSPRAAPCVLLGFPPDALGWQFYHPTSRRVLSSQDVMFDELIPYYRLFPYRTPSLPPPPLFLVPGPPLVDPLPPEGPAPSGVSHVEAVEPVEVAGDSGGAEGAERGGADSWGADSRGAERVGATRGGAETEGVLRLEVLSLRELGLLVWHLTVLKLAVLRVLHLAGSHSLHRSCVSGLPGAGGELLELEVLRILEVLLLLWVLVPRIFEVLVLGVLELLGLRVLLERELLRVLAWRLLLSVLEAVLLRVLMVLLEVLELEVLPLGVLVLSLLCLESPRGLGRTSFRSFSRFLVSRLLLVLLLL
ncbi:unnamed protein product [Closterium sp. NIES-64]|nr:unnamed protein product [Closterium sp. NIES-64]